MLLFRDSKGIKWLREPANTNLVACTINIIVRYIIEGNIPSLVCATKILIWFEKYTRTFYRNKTLNTQDYKILTNLVQVLTKLIHVPREHRDMNESYDNFCQFYRSCLVTTLELQHFYEYLQTMQGCEMSSLGPAWIVQCGKHNRENTSRAKSRHGLKRNFDTLSSKEADAPPLKRCRYEGNRHIKHRKRAMKRVSDEQLVELALKKPRLV